MRRWRGRRPRLTYRFCGYVRADGRFISPFSRGPPAAVRRLPRQFQFESSKTRARDGISSPNGIQTSSLILLRIAQLGLWYDNGASRKFGYHPSRRGHFSLGSHSALERFFRVPSCSLACPTVLQGYPSPT